jgi:hypothetical protein
MATRYANIITACDTDAHFRLWINEFHSAITGFGWVQTSDTGQISFASVVHPSAAGVYSGYAVYRMADGYQSANPVFLRVDFGASPNSANTPAVKFRLSSAMDGAGNHTGSASTVSILSPCSASTSVAVGVWSAGNTGSFRMVLGCNDIGNAGFIVVIERDKDFYGNDTGLGVSLLTYYSVSNANANTMQFMGNTGELSTVDNKWWSLVHVNASNDGGVGVIRPQLGRFRNPLKTVVLASYFDYQVGASNVSLNIYGVSRTFAMLSPCATTAQNFNGLNTAAKIGILWE